MPACLRFDRVLLGTVLGLTLFGLLMIFSVTTADADPTFRYVIKQLLAVAIGLWAMRRLMFGDYHALRNQRTVFAVLAAAMALLVIAWFAGVGANTNRFLRMGQISVQPSEIAKLALILFLAYYLDGKEEKLRDWRSLGGGALVLAALALLVLAGRDLGTAICLAVIAGVMLWTAGLRFRYFALGGAAVAALGAIAVAIEPYRLRRLTAFLNPEADPQGAGFQILQSEIAVGSGGFLGQGLMLGRQKMRFLPEAHTDFIFAVIGEELGMLGGLIVVLAFGVILWRGLLAARRAPDAFGSSLATGVTAMILCQAMINLGVVLAMLPTKGMPLPFVSYGGTSMIACLAGAGLLLNVSQHAR